MSGEHDPFGTLARMRKHRVGIEAAAPLLPIAPPQRKRPPDIPAEPRRLSFTLILGIVMEESGFSLPEILGNARQRPLTDARSVAANLAAILMGKSLASIDVALNRGVGLAHYYVNRHRDRLALYPEYRALYERCAARLGGAS